MLGTDRGLPPLTGTTTLTVSVIRNNAPVFSPPSRTENLNNRQTTGVLFTYTATDNDDVSFVKFVDCHFKKQSFCIKYMK